MSNEPPQRTLSHKESLLLSSLSAAGYTVFTIEDARALLGDDDDSVRKVLHHLNRKRWLKRLERGTYLLVPLAAGPGAEWAEHEYLIAASLIEPYYLAYATALHYYGYSERTPGPVVVATTRRKRSVEIAGLTYRFVTLRAHKFFGYEPIALSGTTVHMAEPEKAIADGFDHPDLAGGVLEPAKGLWIGSQQLDWEKLVSYALRLRNRVAARRLGYWMELLAVGNVGLLSRLEGGAGHSYASLEPSGPAEGVHNTRWRITVNIPERQLLEWREH